VAVSIESAMAAMKIWRESGENEKKKAAGCRGARRRSGKRRGAERRVESGLSGFS
jgi:hypothetical protein